MNAPFFPLRTSGIRRADGRTFCRAFAERLELLILNADDPAEAMDEIAKAAARGGLILDDAIPRRTSAMAFVMDLLTDNPAASDWMNGWLTWMRPPFAYQHAHEVAEHLM